MFTLHSITTGFRKSIFSQAHLQYYEYAYLPANGSAGLGSTAAGPGPREYRVHQIVARALELREVIIMII